ncbi:MAG: lectin like domain-containing protein [Clostridiales Family XIII bacterium]|jgi:C1A family cysteine protease|nr:lectin like domain-containing protein [Clostridiales Family XIII bacterium]
MKNSRVDRFPRRRAVLAATLSVALILCQFSPFSSAETPAVEADRVVETPSDVKFVDIPDVAFEDKINDAEYYASLFPGGVKAPSASAYSAAAESLEGKKGGVSPQSVVFGDLADFDWRGDWNNPLKLDQRPASSPVFPTRNQGAFGSCWSFAALASAEGSLVMNGLVSGTASNYLSPYHLVFSAYNEYTFAPQVVPGNIDMNSYSKAAMNGGGNSDMAGSAMSKWFGPMPEAQYGYPTTANPAAITAVAQLNQSRFHMQDALNFPSPNDEKTGVAGGRGAATVIPAQLNAIKNALYIYGPLSTSYSADGTYRQTGVYYDGQANGSTTYYQTANDYANHAVVVVGWNDNVPASAFDNGSGIIPKGNGAFLIQNTWGEKWGDGGGFFWLSYYDPSIGISTYFSMYNTSNSDNIYYWDDSGYAGAKYYNLSWYSGKQINYMSNVFTVTAQAAANSIQAVGIYTPAPGTQYEISVYRNPPAGKPSGGEALPIGDGGATSMYATSTFAGYHTVFFGQPQHLDAGDTFAVVVKVLNNNADDSALTCEGILFNYGSNVDNVKIGAGESYYSSDGSSWTDLSTTYARSGSGLGNFNIRVYTSGVGISSIGFSPEYPVQNIYKVGDEFNYGVGKIQIAYADGAVSYIPLLDSNVRIAGFGSETPGMRTINISFMGHTLTYNINVIEWNWVTGVAEISGAPKIYNYDPTEKTHDVNLTASVAPANASDKNIEWAVTGPAVITSTGISTAKLSFTGEGDVTVTATSKDVRKFDCSVSILSAAKVTAITSPLKTIYMKKNSSYTLPFLVYNGNTVVKPPLTYTSSAPKTLSVSSGGKLKAHNVKKNTKITVTIAASNGYKKAFTVYVVPKAKKLKSAKLTGVPSKLKRGAYKQLTLKLGTSSATNLTPKFSSSKSSVLTVDSTGKVFAKKKGSAKVTVKVGGRKVTTKTIKVS